MLVGLALPIRAAHQELGRGDPHLRHPVVRADAVLQALGHLLAPLGEVVRPAGRDAGARTGAPWRDLPPEYGSWHTVYSRFSRWRPAAVCEGVLERVLAVAGEEPIDANFVDGLSIRAHQHAAGARGGSPPKPKAAPGAGSARRCTCAVTGADDRWDSS
ncbi:MAG: transposase [Armatimonadetes bacterium]|nr:transposase [Armatimonadota bacterium]